MDEKVKKTLEKYKGEFMGEKKFKTVKDWHNEARKRFGNNVGEWKFVCPSCGHITSIQDWRDVGAGDGEIAFSCIGRHMKDLNELLEKHIEETKQLSELMVQIRIDMAVHEVKLARSGAFYGAVSGMIIAIITALIINFATSSHATEQPKVIYKDEKTK